MKFHNCEELWPYERARHERMVNIFIEVMKGVPLQSVRLTHHTSTAMVRKNVHDMIKILQLYCKKEMDDILPESPTFKQLMSHRESLLTLCLKYVENTR